MKYCSNWVEIHGFTPNLSSMSCLVELGIIPMNSTGIYLNEFTPNSTGPISNSTGHEILLKMDLNSLRLIVCLPGRIAYHSNEFNWHLSQWIYSQFDLSNSTGHEILLKMGRNSLKLHHPPMKNKYKVTQYI